MLVKRDETDIQKVKSEDDKKDDKVRESDAKKNKDDAGKGKQPNDNNEEYDGDDLFDNDSDEGQDDAGAKQLKTENSGKPNQDGRITSSLDDRSGLTGHQDAAGQNNGGKPVHRGPNDGPANVDAQPTNELTGVTAGASRSHLQDGAENTGQFDPD